MLKFKINRFI